MHSPNTTPANKIKADAIIKYAFKWFLFQFIDMKHKR